MKKLISLVAAFISGGFILAGIVYYRAEKNKSEMTAEIKEYIDETYRAERRFIENLPIYRDYITPGVEKSLRTYLLRDHLRIARLKGVSTADDADIREYVEQKKLVSAEPSENDHYYFYNVPKKYRYFTPETLKGLKLITQKIQKILEDKTGISGVKIAVSSAIRPDKYQQKLRGRNANASFTSSHSYGVSFDLFYEDFFVDLSHSFNPEQKTRYRIAEKIKTRTGYMMGDSLRRQFRAVLTEALYRLQKEGVIYAILEKRQRCYHVSVL